MLGSLSRGLRGLGGVTKTKGLPITVPCANYANYLDSPLEGPPSQYTDVEKSYAEWKYVEQLFPPKHVPLPPTEAGAKFPSGWSVPNPPKDCPYHIPRTRNHLIPVYCLIWDRGQLRETRIKAVEGDIWLLEKEVGSFLKKLYGKDQMILTYTNEVARCVGIRGDHAEIVKEWLAKKGF